MEGNKEKSCLNCPDRKLHCHATCEHHLKRVAKNEQIRKARRKAVDEESFHRTVHSHNRGKGPRK
jgi:hypothetical protein